MRPLVRILLQAVFVTSVSAVVSWEQPPGIALTCIRIYHVGEQYPAGICLENLPAGPQRLELPGPRPRQWYAPRTGDRIVLAFGMDDVGEARLGESAIHTVYLPTVAKQETRLSPRLVYLAWVGR